MYTLISHKEQIPTQNNFEENNSFSVRLVLSC